ncbi:MAG: hypothetical protein ACREIA_03405 [Opitutaceae bacterium]
MKHSPFASIVVVSSALLLHASAANAFSTTWELIGEIDNVENGGFHLKVGDHFVFRFVIDHSTPADVTPTGPGSPEVSAIFEDALSHVSVLTFPFGPSVESVSGSIHQHKLTHATVVSYRFDIIDGVTPAALSGVPFQEAVVNFMYAIPPQAPVDKIVTPAKAFSVSELTYFSISWYANGKKISAQGRVTKVEMLRVRGL